MAPALEDLVCSPAMGSSSQRAPLSRRDLVGWLGQALLALGLGMSALLTWRFSRRPSIDDLSRRVAIGPLAALPQGASSNLHEHDLLVLHDAGGLYALSTRCSHLGCGLLFEAEGFACPCHGARFTLEGKVRSGPAPAALSWHRVSIDRRGTVWAHLDERVPLGTRTRA